MDIRLLGESATTLDPNLLAEVERGMRKGSANRGEGQTVGNSEDGGQEQRRVGAVLLDVESILGGEDAGDVVVVTSIVEGMRGQDGQVLGVPNVGEVHSGGDDPEEEDEASQDVGLSPPWDGEGRAVVGDLGPIERDKGHAKTRGVTEQRVDGVVMRSDPSDPREGTEGAEEITGKDVPDGTTNENVQEETFTGDTATLTHTSVVLGVKSVEKRTVY